MVKTFQGTFPMTNFLKIALPFIVAFTLGTPINAQGENAQACLDEAKEGDALITACLAGLQEIELDAQSKIKMQGILGDTYYKVDDYQAAIEVYKKLATQEPENWIHPKDLGWSYIETDEYELALTAFEASLAIVPKSNSYRGKATVLRILGRYDEALNAISNALEIAPKFRRSMAELARIHAHAGNTEKALQAFNETVLEHPNYAYGWSYKGDFHHELDQFSDAIKQFKMAILIMPENRFFHNDLAWSYWGNDDYEQALSSFDESLAIAENENAFGGKASSLSLLDRHSEALVAIDKALELERDIWNLNEKGWIYQRADLHEKAATAFDVALDLDPKYASSWYGKAENFASQGNYAKALEMIDNAISSNPRTLYLHRRVYYLRSLEYNGQSRAAVDSYLAEHPHNTDLVYQKMWTYYDIDRIDDGVAYITGEIERDPENTILINALIEFAEEAEQWQVAIDTTQKIIDLNLDKDETYRDLAWYNLELGEFQECISKADDTIKISPNWSIGYYYRAKCNLELGNNDAAFAEIKTSVLNGLDGDVRDEFITDLISAGAPIYAARLGLMRLRD
jgi:tetratricopeptide (TPR) repeat protein